MTLFLLSPVIGDGVEGKLDPELAFLFGARR
jgi:hypothetical protein